MKHSILLITTAAGLIATGCKPSSVPEQQSAQPAPEVQGQAITRLQETEAEDEAALEQAQAPAAEPENPASQPAEAATTAPEKAVQVAALEKKPEAPAAKPAPKAPVQTAPAAKTPAPVAKAADQAATNPAPAEKKEAAAESTELVDGEFLPLTFDKLASFEYEVPEEEYDPDKKPDPKNNPDQIPPEIKALDKKRVALKGFMLPLKVEDGLITELLIMRDQSMCCYGTVPKINEWVSVRMTGKGVKPIMDQAVTIYGRLKVGEIRENGYLVGIYEMDGEKLTGPLDL